MDNISKISLIKIAWSFFKTGIIGFGGGPSVIPLIKHDVVQLHKWTSEDKFNQTFSLANVLPGPIATKMAAYVGYQLRGILGLFVAVFAHILPSALAIILLISMVNEFSTSPVVQGMISAVVPVVAVMLAVMTYEFMQKAWKGLGWIGAIVTFVIVLLLMEVAQLHSAIIIIGFIVLGMTYHRWGKIFKAGKGEL